VAVIAAVRGGGDAAVAWFGVRRRAAGRSGRPGLGSVKGEVGKRGMRADHHCGCTRATVFPFKNGAPASGKVARWGPDAALRESNMNLACCSRSCPLPGIPVGWRRQVRVAAAGGRFLAIASDPVALLVGCCCAQAQMPRQAQQGCRRHRTRHRRCELGAIPVSTLNSSSPAPASHTYRWR
jgi:hypothetical protein